MAGACGKKGLIWAFRVYLLRGTIMTKLADDHSNISYFVQSRINALALLIENSSNSDAGQGLAEGAGRAIFSATDEADAEAAARLLATSLGMSFQAVDIGKLYNEYCDEVENHLERTLKAAQDDHSLLYFYHLDRCFGHDPARPSGHDLHVQLDVDYFLKILACFEVPVILYTRSYHRLDQGILRLFSCVIDMDEGMQAARTRVS